MPLKRWSISAVILRKRWSTGLVHSRCRWYRRDIDSEHGHIARPWHIVQSGCSAGQRMTTASLARPVRNPSRHWTTASVWRGVPYVALPPSSSVCSHDDGFSDVLRGFFASRARENRETTSLRHLSSTCSPGRRSSSCHRGRRATSCRRSRPATLTAPVSSVPGRPIGHHLTPCRRWFPAVQRSGRRLRSEVLTNWQLQHRRRRLRRTTTTIGTKLSLCIT